jgi:hypothetical protein
MILQMVIQATERTFIPLSHPWPPIATHENQAFCMDLPPPASGSKQASYACVCFGPRGPDALPEKGRRMSLFGYCGAAARLERGRAQGGVAA